MTGPTSDRQGSHAPIVRTALPGEREAVIDLLQALNVFEAPLTGDRLTDRATAAAYYAVLLQRIAAQAGRLLVAEAEGRIVGVLGFVVDEDKGTVRADLRRRGFVTDLIVEEAWRRRGVGRLLLAEAEGIARDKGLKRLALGVVAGNGAAERTYAAAGFRPAATILVKPLSGEDR